MRLPLAFALLLVLLSACSPESSFLNTAEKREAARLTDEQHSQLRSEWDSLCMAETERILPTLIDSLLQVRREEMAKRKTQ